MALPVTRIFRCCPDSPAIDTGGKAPKHHGHGHGHDDDDASATSDKGRKGNHADCPATDQIGERRVNACDIGAIEFQPSRHHGWER